MCACTYVCAGPCVLVGRVAQVVFELMANRCDFASPYVSTRSYAHHLSQRDANSAPRHDGLVLPPPPPLPGSCERSWWSGPRAPRGWRACRYTGRVGGAWLVWSVPWGGMSGCSPDNHSKTGCLPVAQSGGRAANLRRGLLRRSRG